MRQYQSNTERSLTTVDGFVVEYANELAELASSEMYRQLHSCVVTIRLHVANQLSNGIAMKGAVETRRRRRAILVQDHMEPIVAVARVYLPNTPEFVALRMPSLKLGGQRLADTAKAMAEKAGEHASVFTNAGLSPNFVAELNTAADTMAATLAASGSAQSGKKAATQGIHVLLQQGRKIVRAIDPIVRKAFRGDKVMLSKWASARHVVKVPSRSTASVLVPAPVFPVPPSSTPAVSNTQQ